MDASTLYALGAVCAGVIVFVCFVVGISNAVSENTETALIVILLIQPIGWIIVVIWGAMIIWTKLFKR